MFQLFSGSVRESAVTESSASGSKATAGIDPYESLDPVCKRPVTAPGASLNLRGCCGLEAIFRALKTYGFRMGFAVLIASRPLKNQLEMYKNNISRLFSPSPPLT
jgi:hypothetical protein